MNRIPIAVAIFASTFIVGILAVLLTSEHASTTPPLFAIRESDSAERTSPSNPVDLQVPAMANDSGVEFVGLSPYEMTFPDSDDLIDVFQSEGTYRASEVIARSGETWLTLVERNGAYRIEPARAKVTTTRTKSYAGDEFEVRLSFDKPGTTILATRSRLGLKAGPVTTVYHRPSQDEIARRNLPIGFMETGYKQDFRLNDDRWYTLRVSRGLDTEGTRLGVLVLEHDGTTQVVATNSEEIIGQLLWVGDLDGDNKLDLYFNDFNEKGVFVVGLYLSSAAESGSLVKRVAMFSAGGC